MRRAAVEGGPASSGEAGPDTGSAPSPRLRRLAMGLTYRGQAYEGWQTQPHGRTVQDHLERALCDFTAGVPVRTHCAGRTDAGVHALNQVVHFDTLLDRERVSWVRGCNRFLPPDVSVEWCREVPADFDARFSARGRRYAYVLRQDPVRTGVETRLAGWVFRPLDADAMRLAARALIGEHDFSAFRSSQCQAASPVRTLHRLDIQRIGSYWRFDFDGNAFLHHMVRNIVGCLVDVGAGSRSPEWLLHVLASCDRKLASGTFAADGLYFLGPYYDAQHDLPRRTAAMDWLPGGYSMTIPEGLPT